MPPRKPNALTNRQGQVLAWIKDFIAEHDMPPTVREIGGAFEIKSSTVHEMLRSMERKGHLRRGDRGARSLIVQGAKKKRDDCHCISIPILGHIAAGKPVLAVEQARGTVAVDRSLLRGRKAYALEVEGESMVGARIFDGDYVVVRNQQTADDGDIIVALVDDEATLKRVYRERGGVRLEPANPRMKAIHVRDRDFRVQGKVVSVLRMLNDKTSGGR